MIASVAADAFGLLFLRRPWVRYETFEFDQARRRFELACDLLGCQRCKGFSPDSIWNGNLDTAPNAADLVTDCLQRDITVNLAHFSLRSAKRRLNHTHDAVNHQRDTKAEQCCVGVTERVKFAA